MRKMIIWYYTILTGKKSIELYVDVCTTKYNMEMLDLQNCTVICSKISYCIELYHVISYHIIAYHSMSYHIFIYHIIPYIMYCKPSYHIMVFGMPMYTLFLFIQETIWRSNRFSLSQGRQKSYSHDQVGPRGAITIIWSTIYIIYVYIYIHTFYRHKW